MISLLNILNFINVFLYLIFQVFLVRIFGATFQTDIYYLSIVIVQFITVFYWILIDLYIPVYNDIKVRSEEEAKRFTGAVFTLMLIVGMFLCVTVFSTAPYLLNFLRVDLHPKK